MSALMRMRAVALRCGLRSCLSWKFTSSMRLSDSGISGSNPEIRKTRSTGILNARASAARVAGRGVDWPLNSLLITARFKSAERARSDWDQPRLCISLSNQSLNLCELPAAAILEQFCHIPCFCWERGCFSVATKVQKKCNKPTPKQNKSISTDMPLERCSYSKIFLLTLKLTLEFIIITILENNDS